METTIKQIFTCKMCQKQRWESDFSRKMQISHTFCWSKSISGAFDSNPVDTRRRFNVDTMSFVYRERVDYIKILIISALPWTSFKQPT